MKRALFPAFSFVLSLWLGPAAANAATSLTSGDHTLVVDGPGLLRVSHKDRAIIDLETIRFDYRSPIEAARVIEANGNTIRLSLAYPNSVDFSRSPDDESPRQVELTIKAIDNGFHLTASPEWGDQTTLVFNYLGDHFFGLSEPLQPDNQFSPDLTGASIAVDVASEGGQLMENYATAYSAFYMSSAGYGSFFDTYARGRYDFAINGKNRIHHDTGELDWYLLFGDNGPEIHKSYFEIVGKPKKIPLWGLGPVGWRDQNDGGAAEILDDIQKMTDLKIPFSAWFVDRPYSDGNHAWSQMNFNDKFANPGEWIKRIREDFGLEFMTWTATATFGDARFHKHLPGSFSYIDLTDEQTVSEYKSELTTKQYAHGVRGHKIDRADEIFPIYETWADKTIPPEQRRNLYAMLFVKIHDEALRAVWGDDQMTFTRAAYHRAQPYLSAVWGGDPRTNWDGFQGNFANAMRCSFMGFPVWGSDVGGYQGEGYIPEDFYLRWHQAGSFSGLFEIKLDGSGGYGRDRMPWRYDEEFQSIFRHYCEERMRFIPYLYTLVANASETGALMQPLAYRHLDDPETYDIWDQFYLGDSILVAPVFTKGTRRSVYLPEGNWRDYSDPSKRFSGRQRLEIEAPLAVLPRFVRENSLYVTGALLPGNSSAWDNAEPSLTIHALPGEIGQTRALNYVDPLDGDQRKRIVMVRTQKSLTLESPAIACPVKLAITTDKLPAKVEQGGTSLPFEYSESTGILTIPFEAGKTIKVAITY